MNHGKPCHAKSYVPGNNIPKRLSRPQRNYYRVSKILQLRVSSLPQKLKTLCLSEINGIYGFRNNVYHRLYKNGSWAIVPEVSS